MKSFLPRKIKVVICATLIVVASTFAPVHKAQAVIPVIDGFLGGLTKIFHALSIASQHLTNLTLGLPGSGAATRAALKGGKAACSSYDKALAIADTADNFSSVAVLTG